MSVYTLLGPAILTFVALMAGAWMLLRGRVRSWYTRQMVTCPADGLPADVDVMTTPNPVEFLVTRRPAAKSEVCACSRFEGPVTCAQECLNQRNW